MPSIKVGDGVELYHEDFGEGPPVVFVHGGAATHSMWDHQVHHLGPVPHHHLRPSGCRAVGQATHGLHRRPAGRRPGGTGACVGAPPRRGHPRQPRARRARGAALPAPASRRRGASGADVGRPWFVGDRDGSGGFTESFASDLATQLGRNHAQANWDRVENWLYHADPGEPMKIAHLQMALEWPLHVLRTLMQDLPNADHRSYLPQIRQLALVLHGRHDRKNRFEGSQYLSQALRNARLVVFDDSAHCPSVEELDVYNATLADFASTSMSSDPAGPTEQERS